MLNRNIQINLCTIYAHDIAYISYTFGWCYIYIYIYIYHNSWYCFYFIYIWLMLYTYIRFKQMPFRIWLRVTLSYDKQSSLFPQHSTHEYVYKNKHTLKLYKRFHCVKYSYNHFGNKAIYMCLISKISQFEFDIYKPDHVFLLCFVRQQTLLDKYTIATHCIWRQNLPDNGNFC